MRRSVLALAAVLASFAPSAHALTWPDVPERIEKDLASTDPSTRRTAAIQLPSLSASRATPLVITALADPDVEVRLAAADAAVRLDVRAATEAVLPWLGDREARLRAKACDVARSMPSGHAVPQLARALGDPEVSVRNAAAEALGSSGSADAVPALLGKLDDPSPPTRMRIIAALARLGDRRAVIPLVGKVQDAVSDVRREVAHALGDLGDERASQALLLQLRDNIPEVRVDALAALGRLHAKDAVDAIAPLATDRTPALRQAAIGALGRIGTPEAVRVLATTLGQGDDAGGALEPTPVREALVAAGASSIPAMRDLLDGPASPAVATSAAWVLGQLRATGEANTLVAAMRRGVLAPGPALHALARAGGSATLPVVLEFIGDQNPQNRAEAALATSVLLDPTKPDGRAVEPIEAALRDSRLGTDERARLAALLGRTGAPRAAQTLAGLAKSKDVALKLAAIDAMGSLGPGAAQQSDALLDLIADTDPTTRLRAAIALGDAGSAHARDALLSKLDTSEELDRAAVLTALAGILAREPSDAAVAKLEASLDLSVGPERDAILVAIGRSSGTAANALARAAKHEDGDDRRTVATLLAGQPAAQALPVALALADDRDATVRAGAAWSLGTVGDVAAATKLLSLTHDPNGDVSANAAAAIGRVAARLKNPALAASMLCPMVDDARLAPEPRANALGALAVAQARCGDGGAKERRALEDPSEVVRLSAALALHNGSSPEDNRALERCSSFDRSAAVAHRCGATPSSASGPPHAMLVYVSGDGHAAPVPRSPYLLVMADSLLHMGTTDRRGAVFDPVAPSGDVTLRRRSEGH